VKTKITQLLQNEFQMKTFNVELLGNFPQKKSRSEKKNLQVKLRKHQQNLLRQQEKKEA
jgi:hypothetical protein